MVVLVGLAACVPPRAPRRDAGLDAADAGAPIAFSIGITDNASVSHQVAAYINLALEVGSPSAETVLSRRVPVPPVLDGVDSDWATIAGSQIPLQPAGAAIGMTVDEWNTGFGLLADGGLRPFDFGVDRVLVKSAFDDSNIYFLVQWNDATASTAKNSLTFANGAWARSTEDEDRLYLGFDVAFPDFADLGCLAACHLRERQDDTSDAGVQYRVRMHTNDAGELMDAWSWGSVATNPMSHADDVAFDQINKVNDNTKGFSTTNRRILDGGALEPISMSEYGVNSNPSVLYAPDAGLHPVAVPFNPAGLDAGAYLPGVVHQIAGGSRADVRAVGKWRNGKWTVELARARVTSDPNDVRF